MLTESKAWQHISEMSLERVNNPADYVKIGETIDAKIIAIDKDLFEPQY